MIAKFEKPKFIADDQPRITATFLLAISDLFQTEYESEPMIAAQDKWRLQASRDLATVDGLVWG